MSRPLSQIIQPSTAMAGIPSAAAAAAPRQLSLTEELERLEQSITLTMQEIDRNFNQCHRIITHSIMPIVDRYAEHSRDLCDGVSFWKSFFEDSADVAIGTYESRPDEEVTMTTEETYDDSRLHGGDEGDEQGANETDTTAMRAFDSGDEQREDQTITLDEDTDSTDHELEDESILASMNLTGRDALGKPKRPDQPTKWAAMESPYDKLKKEVKRQQERAAARRNRSIDDSLDESMTPPRLDALGLHSSKPSSMLDSPTTPDILRQGPSRRVLDSPADDDSPFAPSTARATTAAAAVPPSRRTAKRDPILHRAVDTNWRIQATPQRKTPGKPPATIMTTTPKHRVLAPYADSSPMSSPPPPQITTVFSPVNPARRFNIKPREKPEPTRAISAAPTGKDPKTPVTTRKRWETLDPKTMTAKDLLLDDDDDDDDDDFDKLGFSPPVTMQFTLPPSRLMQTPAKQASKMLVNDIMRSAGFRAGFAGGDDTQTTVDQSLQDSPSMLAAQSPTFDFD